MKQSLVFLVATVLVLSLVACGSDGGAAALASPAPTASSVSSESAPADSPSVEAVLVDDWGLTEAYMGMSSNNEAICIGMNDDMSLTVFVAMAKSGEYVNFVGPAVDNGDGTMTITDETDNSTLSFGVTILDSGNLELNLGDLGTAEVSVCEVSEVIDAIKQIDASGLAIAGA